MPTKIVFFFIFKYFYLEKYNIPIYQKPLIKSFNMRGITQKNTRI